jgi:chloramphenicol-sensitive protein RarD
MSESSPSPRGGMLYGLICYGLWGVVPLYFNAIVELSGKQISAVEILAQRIVWSVVVLVPLLSLSRRWPLVVKCFRVPALRWTFLATSVLIGLNWFIYIYSVASNQVVQSSLGYFINPLVNVAMGMVFFHERLRFLQWIAIGLAVIGVAGMTAAVGELPWIALTLAGSFSVFGLLRKKAPVDGLVGLSVETIVLLPLAVGYLLVLACAEGTSLWRFGPLCDVLLLSSGLVTALPLMCFGQAARRLRLSTLGFLQYLSPSLQFLCAVAVIGEPVKPTELASFAWIWAGLAVFAVDAVLRRSRG